MILLRRRCLFLSETKNAQPSTSSSTSYPRKRFRYLHGKYQRLKRGQSDRKPGQELKKSFLIPKSADFNDILSLSCGSISASADNGRIQSGYGVQARFMYGSVTAEEAGR
jgi:hypothetical protein